MKLFKFERHKDVIVAGITLIMMWAGYYCSQHEVGGRMFSFCLSIGIMILLCVVFPVWWVTHIDKEGIAGLRIQRQNLGISLVLSALLAVWRGYGAREYMFQMGAVWTILFNLLAIWEVIFIYGWLFTRFEKCFGKIPAILLTAVSVGIYHIGSLTPDAILRLCGCVLICSVAYAVVNNIFLLWPIYWAIGTSASTMGSGMSFPMEMVIMSAGILAIQIAIIVGMEIRFRKKVKAMRV